MANKWPLIFKDTHTHTHTHTHKVNLVYLGFLSVQMQDSSFIFEYIIKEMFMAPNKVKDEFLKCVQVFVNFIKQSSDPRAKCPWGIVNTVQSSQRCTMHISVMDASGVWSVKIPLFNPALDKFTNQTSLFWINTYWYVVPNITERLETCFLLYWAENKIKMAFTAKV